MNTITKEHKCSMCSEYKSAENFWSNSSRSSGLDSRCKPCGVKCKKLKRVWQNPQQAFSRYKRSAQVRGHVFELSKLEFESFEDSCCFYCNEKIQGFGLDRVDNEQGYILNNVVPCCGVCNKFKGSFTQGAFIEHCVRIAKTFGGLAHP